jgi:hypothetical protein
LSQHTDINQSYRWAPHICINTGIHVEGKIYWKVLESQKSGVILFLRVVSYLSCVVPCLGLGLGIGLAVVLSLGLGPVLILVLVFS